MPESEFELDDDALEVAAGAGIGVNPTGWQHSPVGSTGGDGSVPAPPAISDPHVDQTLQGSYGLGTTDPGMIHNTFTGSNITNYHGSTLLGGS